MKCSYFLSLQVPLSALSPPDAHLGAVGGFFNSTTKVKSVPLPTLYHRHQATQRGIRNVRLHSNRYTPGHVRTISDSLLHLPKLDNHQRNHLTDRETDLKKCRSLQHASGVVPHRIERMFYMSGNTVQLFENQGIPQEELRALQHQKLSQNPDLYYGKGIRSMRAQSKIVQRFEARLKEATEESRSYGLEDVNIDTGRFSRASRALTPASPILEEEPPSTHVHPSRSRRSPKKTFMTEEQGRRETGADSIK